MLGTTYLFVYGTLRPGTDHPMADYLSRNSRFVGRARTLGRLYDLGDYPGATEMGTNDDWIVGDLLELRNCDAVLRQLDRYENAGRQNPSEALFRRAIVQVEQHSGEILEAWIYFYCRPVLESRRIASGEYLASS